MFDAVFFQLKMCKNSIKTITRLFPLNVTVNYMEKRFFPYLLNTK